VWDTHSTGANDSIAELVLQLGELYNNVQRAQRMHEVPRQFYPMTHPLYMGQQGKIDMSIYMMPRVVAEELDNIAGIGRGSPNQNPYLPAPNRQPQGQRVSTFGQRLLNRRSSAPSNEMGFSGALPSSNGSAAEGSEAMQASEKKRPSLLQRMRGPSSNTVLVAKKDPNPS